MTHSISISWVPLYREVWSLCSKHNGIVVGQRAFRNLVSTQTRVKVGTDCFLFGIAVSNWGQNFEWKRKPLLTSFALLAIVNLGGEIFSVCASEDVLSEAEFGSILN